MEVIGLNKSPLFAASAFGYLDIVKFLLPLIEEPFLPNGDAKAPIHLARIAGHHEIVQIMGSYDIY